MTGPDKASQAALGRLTQALAGTKWLVYSASLTVTGRHKGDLPERRVDQYTVRGLLGPLFRWRVELYKADKLDRLTVSDGRMAVFYDPAANRYNRLRVVSGEGSKRAFSLNASGDAVLMVTMPLLFASCTAPAPAHPTVGFIPLEDLPMAATAETGAVLLSGSKTPSAGRSLGVELLLDEKTGLPKYASWAFWSEDSAPPPPEASPSADASRLDSHFGVSIREEYQELRNGSQELPASTFDWAPPAGAVLDPTLDVPAPTANKGR